MATAKNSRRAIAAALLLAILALDVGAADAFPSDFCRRAADCNAHEYCLADSIASSSGRCREGRVLP